FETNRRTRRPGARLLPYTTLFRANRALVDTTEGSPRFSGLVAGAAAQRGLRCVAHRSLPGRVAHVCQPAAAANSNCCRISGNSVVITTGRLFLALCRAFLAGLGAGGTDDY